MEEGNVKGILSLRAGAELVALEFEIEAAACETEFASSSRDIAAMLPQGFRDHATLDFLQGVSKREVLH